MDGVGVGNSRLGSRGGAVDGAGPEAVEVKVPSVVNAVLMAAAVMAALVLSSVRVRTPAA